jgi:hypothetical protein
MSGLTKEMYMSFKIIIISLGLLACLSISAWAQNQPNMPGLTSAFYGYVTYSGISGSFSQGDRVSIRNALGGDLNLYCIQHRYSNRAGYTSDSKYASGQYYLTVVLSPSSNSVSADVKLVSHNGAIDQEVDLNVHGNIGK